MSEIRPQPFGAGDDCGGRGHYPAPGGFVKDAGPDSEPAASASERFERNRSLALAAGLK